MTRYKDLDFNIVVIGASVTCLYQLHCPQTLGLRIQVFKAGTDVGGTWYLN